MYYKFSCFKQLQSQILISSVTKHSYVFLRIFLILIYLFFVIFIAILAKIKTGLRIRPANIYIVNFEVEVKRIFHQPNSNIFTKGGKKIIFSPRTTAMCNAHVRRNTLYLLGGSIKRNKVYVTSCGLLSKWTKLSKHMRKAFRKNKLSCNCMVTGCHSNRCLRHYGGQTKTGKCRRVSTHKRKCFENNGICIQDGGVCKFSKSSLERINTCLGKNKTRQSEPKKDSLAKAK